MLMRGARRKSVMLITGCLYPRGEECGRFRGWSVVALPSEQKESRSMFDDIATRSTRFDANFLPLARESDLVVTQSENETLVYDQRLHHIHHLTDPARAIWDGCNGRSTIEDISHMTGLAASRVRLVLGTLSDLGLLDQKLPDSLRPRPVTRRRLNGIALVAVIGIKSISAPSAAAADSTCIAVGDYDSNCMEKACCNSGFCNELDPYNGRCIW